MNYPMLLEYHAEWVRISKGEAKLLDIEVNSQLERIKVSSGRKGKDYAFKYKDMDRYVYINCRPLGKRSGAGDDPNELMTAALCLKSSLKAPQNSDFNSNSRYTCLWEFCCFQAKYTSI